MSNKVQQGSIFNVDEAQGVERVKHETTAANAQAEAPNSRVAHQVEENAEQVKEAGEKAAQAAQGMGPEMTGEGGSKLDELQRQAAQTTNAAVAEGQKDVHVAKATGVGYLDQAKSIAGSVLSSAQGYLQGGEQNSQPQGGSHNGSGPGSAKVATAQGTTADVLSTLQTSASSAIGTTQQYLSSAQAAAQPHIDNARTTVEPHLVGAKAALQPHMDKTKETAQGYLGLGTGPTGSVTPPGASTAAGTGIPATSAPLEGKEGVAPYPTTTTVSGDKQAEGKLKTSVA